MASTSLARVIRWNLRHLDHGEKCPATVIGELLHDCDLGRADTERPASTSPAPGRVTDHWLVAAELGLDEALAPGQAGQRRLELVDVRDGDVAADRGVALVALGRPEPRAELDQQLRDLACVRRRELDAQLRHGLAYLGADRRDGAAKDDLGRAREVIRTSPRADVPGVVHGHDAVGDLP